VNPTLVAASTLMLLMPNPKGLMFGYLCGALMTSITLGLVIVFAFEGSSAVNTAQHTLSPAVDIALGGLALVGAFVLGTGRDQRIADRRERRREEKGDKVPRWQRALQKGSPRTTFLIGAALTLPGASYLLGLHEISQLDYPASVTVLLVIGFNLVMLMLLELPLLGYVLAPDWTPKAIDRAKAAVGSHWHRWVFRGLLVLGTALIVKGLVLFITSG
jgi:hypothetical protein